MSATRPPPVLRLFIPFKKSDRGREMLFVFVIPGVILAAAFCMMVRSENKSARRDQTAINPYFRARGR
jgi:hypothetical protein